MHGYHLISFYADSGNETDLITPALDPHLRVVQLTVLAPESLTASATNVLAVAGRHRLSASLATVDDLWSVEGLLARVKAIIATSQWPCLLNVSGLNPYAAVCLTDLARDLQQAVLCVQPERDALRWLTPQPAELAAHDGMIPDGINLTEYLRLHGFSLQAVEYRNQPLPAGWYESACTLGRAMARHPGLVADIAHVTEGMNGDETPHRAAPALIAALGRIQQWGLVAILPGGHLRLAGLPARRFLRGGWLEALVYAEVLALQETLSLGDVVMGMQVESRDGVRNEIDVGFMRNNQLYVIECKALSPRNQAKAVDWLFKIDSVSHLLGKEVPAMLAFVAHPGSNTRVQAEERDIPLVSGFDLLNLRPALEAWIQRVEG